MKIGFIYFTYRNDEKMLGWSIESLRRLKTVHKIQIFVVDEDSNPITSIPNDVVYMRSTFNRNGNLKGLDCLTGMVHYYELVMNTYKCDAIVKIDCDTYVNSIDWLDNMPETTRNFGSQSLYSKNTLKEPYICCGCFNGITREGLTHLIDNINKQNWYLTEIPKENKYFPEDRFTCRMVNDCNADYTYYALNQHNNPLMYKDDNGIYFDFPMKECNSFYLKNLPFKYLQQYFAVTFKPLSKHSNCNWQRKSSESRMEKYCKFRAGTH